MAKNNKPNKFGKSDTPVVDPNSPEGMAMMAEADRAIAGGEAFGRANRAIAEGEGPPHFGMPGSQSNLGPAYQTPLDQAKAERDAAGADAAGPIEVNPENTADDNRRIVQGRSDRVRRAEQDVGERSQSFQVSPSIGWAEAEQLRGEVWSGGATGARIIMDATGQTWSVTRDGVVSPVDERQAKAIVSWDREKSIQQELKRRTRVEEMELEAGLDALENEGAEFKVFNSVTLQNRMNEHAGFRTPEELAILQDGLYGDAPLMERLMKLPPHTFGPILDQMEAILFGGGGRGALEQYIVGAERQDSTRRTITRANASMGLDDHIDKAEAKLLTASAEIDTLSEKIAAAKDEAANPNSIAGDQTHLLEEWGRQLEEAKKKVINATNDINRAERRQSEITSRAGSEWRGGGKNLDQLLAMDVRRKKLMADGGVMESTLDSVARANGYDGVADANFRDMLAGDPEAVGQFVRECQEHARLSGWETSDDTTDPWVEAVINHVLKDINPIHTAATLKEIAKQIAPGADMPEKDLFAATPEGAELMANNARAFLQSDALKETMPPSQWRVLSSGKRPADNTPEFTDLWFVIEGQAAQAGMSKDEVNVLEREFKSIPQEDVTDGAGSSSADRQHYADKGRYGEGRSPLASVDYHGEGPKRDQPSATSEEMRELEESPADGWKTGRGPYEAEHKREIDQYLNILERVLIDRLKPDEYRFAMNPDGVFDRDKSDDAWDRVEQEAMTFAKENAGLEDPETGVRGLKISAEDMEAAMEILRSRRHGPRGE